MKKIILSLVTVVTLGLSAFASGNNGNVSQQAQDALKKDFATATNITWEQRDTYARATFSLNGQVLTAYYSSNGTSWTQLGKSVSISMSTTVNTGLAVSSVNTSKTCTAFRESTRNREVGILRSYIRPAR